MITPSNREVTTRDAGSAAARHTRSAVRIGLAVIRSCHRRPAEQSEPVTAGRRRRRAA